MKSTLNNLLRYFRWILDETRFKQTTPEIYDRLSQSGEYDTLVDYHSRVESLKVVLKCLNFATKRLVVLDLACGTGAFIEAVVSIFPGSLVTGIDYSKGMLQIAKHRFKSNKKVTLTHENFLTTSFPHQSFDLITFAHALRFIPRGEEANFVKNLAHWIKPHGTVVIVNRVPIWKNLSSAFIGNRITRRYNHLIVLEDYLVKIMGDYFTFDKKIVLRKRLLFETKAYYFHQNG